MDTQVLIAIIAVLAIVVVGLGVWIYMQKRQSTELRSKFGPEYDRALQEHGDRSKAEAELKARRERVSHLHLVPLSPADASRFSDEWRAVQARFVDSPQSAANDADRLVSDLMQKRGYSMGDFDVRAADISVDHPRVVENYRAAHAIALENQRGTANTEDLRRALVHFRALFDELLEIGEPEPVGVKR
jgi:hypothetical protein